MWRVLSAVLAFAIRFRVSPTGRAIFQPRLSVVDGLATRRTSRISGSAPMAKRQGKIDNHFTPGSQDQDSLFTLVFGVVLLALAADALALIHALGGL